MVHGIGHTQNFVQLRARQILLVEHFVLSFGLGLLKKTWIEVKLNIIATVAWGVSNLLVVDTLAVPGF